MFKIDHGIFATFWLTLIIMTGFNCLHFGFLKMVIFFWTRIVKRDHCGMGGKKSITHFRQFSATFGPQEVEPSHDIYICRIVTHILSRPTIRDLSRDDWVKEFIKRKWSSGLFYAVKAAEKKTPNCHKNATFWGGFLMFSRSKNNLKFF